jgi:ABC-type transport system substrate-binding protein
MKKLLFIPLVALVILGLVLGSCGTPASTPTTTTPPTTTKPPTTTTAPPTTTAAPTTTAPPTTTAARPAPYGTITNLSASFAYENWDPNQYGMWSYYVFETVVRQTEDYSFEGAIVDSWDISEDGCTWTFHLHPGNYFTNGDPVTAEDLKYSVDHFGATTSRSAWSLYLRYNLASSTVIDPLTYEYVTNHPESTLLACFANTAVLNKAEIERVGEDEYFYHHPVGSGPWKLVEHISQTSVKFEANTDYWRTDEIPYYQYYVELCVPELATRIAMFRTGESDMLALDDYTRMKALEAEGFATMRNGINGTDSMAFQGTWFPEAGPTGDIRIRQAMSYALNRPEICDTWYAGYATPGGQFFMPEGVFGWTDALQADPYNPTLAASLIEEAGYPDAFADPVIVVYCTSTDQDRLLYYIGYWEAVGLQVDLKVVDVTTYWGWLFHFFAGRIQETDENVGWIWFWKSWGYPNSVYHSANMYTSQGIHGTGNDPTADAMYAVITQQKDYETAWEKMAAFQAYVKGLYINIGVVEYQNLALYNPRTVGAAIGRGAFAGGFEAVGFMPHPTS